MKKLIDAIETVREYNQMNLMEVAAEFEIYSGQKIPTEAIREFHFTGLSNKDFLTSDWLNNFNIKNLYQI